MDHRESYVMQTTLPLVFSYLPLPDILRCAQVCKLWNNIIQEGLSWRTVNLENYQVNLGGMFEALSKKHQVANLRIIDCSFDSNCFDLPVFDKPQIKKFEISETPSVLLNTVSRDMPNLEVLKAKLCVSFVRLELSIFTTMTHLTELKLYCNRGVLYLDTLFFNLGKIRHLYLLGVRALSVNTDPTWEHFLREAQSMPKNDVLETLGFDLEVLPLRFHLLLQKFVSLKKLRLENLRKWDCTPILREISLKPTLTHLELIEVNIPENFRLAFSLCSNISHFTIVLNTPRFYLERFTSDVMEALKTVTHTLKTLTWGFSERYRIYSLNRTNRLIVERLDTSFSALGPGVVKMTLSEFESELKYLLPKTEVRIKMRMNEGNIFD